MSIFNEKQKEAMFSRRVYLPRCVIFDGVEDEWEDVLVCPHCGHSVELDDYGCEDDEEYENLYPTREEVLDIADKEDSNDESDN